VRTAIRSAADYYRVARLGFSLTELRELTLNAARHCFLPEAERAALAEAIRAGRPQAG
jgi:hypothetical protein